VSWVNQTKFNPNVFLESIAVFRALLFQRYVEFTGKCSEILHLRNQRGIQSNHREIVDKRNCVLCDSSSSLSSPYLPGDYSSQQFVFVCTFPVEAEEYDLQIASDSPIAEGTNITFNVTLRKGDKIAPSDDYQFRYKVNSGFEKVRSGKFAFEWGWGERVICGNSRGNSRDGDFSRAKFERVKVGWVEK
jgi:hypothetical protein